MASNNDFEDKPNLRPTKHVDAGGKTIYLHHNPKHPSNKSYIHAVWQESDEKGNRTEDDPFGIQQPHIEYSLNKQKRWQNLNSFRQYIANQSSSSSDDERETLSDNEQTTKKKIIRHRKKQIDIHQTKYRLYESHNISQQADCVSITTNTGSQRIQLPKKTYMQKPVDQSSQQNENNQTINRNTPNVTYFAVVPPPKEKQLANIRKHGVKVRKTKSGFQPSKSMQDKRQIDAMDEINENVEYSSTDEEDLIQYICSVPKPGQLSLNDFVQTVPSDGNYETTIITDNLVTIEPKFDPKSSKFYMEDLPISKRFHRQMSREEKLYKRDKAVYLQQQKKKGSTIVPMEKSHQHLMNVSFRSVFIDKNDLTIENLTEVFGKNFLHAQCYPTKYLFCLTDRLKSYKWLNQFDLFPIYSNLNSYLILILNDDTPSNEKYHRVQVGLNMDLFSDSIEIETLYESTESIYRINDLVDKVIQFIVSLPFDTFKPKDVDLTRKSIVRDNQEDSELSDSEYLNKQIRHLHILDKKIENQTTTILEQEQLNSDVFVDDYDLVRPDICTICCQDINESTSMTAIKACVHWFCNDCWKQYLESSIRSVKLVRCLEWNCEAIVDVGTILSLVNVRCMNLYERNIEKCLVNLSRSFVKCPNKTCSKIIQVIGSSVDHVRCHCGELFCINCKNEAHFPATCNAYQHYITEVYRNGDMISDAHAVTHVQGRNCISCNNFIEKNGGCNHMTCRCGAEFCWSCTGYWKDHYMSDGTFRCPKEKVPLQDELLIKSRNTSRRFYLNAVFHRRERYIQRDSKKTEHAKRLLGTIPLDKDTFSDNNILRTQIDKRQSMLKHLNEMIKYIAYLHRICEFLAVSADGYGNNPSEFRNSIQSFETIVFNMSQVLEGGRGYKAIEQLKQLHELSEKLLERLQRAVTIRELRRQTTNGYATS